MKVWLEKIFLENSDETLIQALKQGHLEFKDVMEYEVPLLATQNGVGNKIYNSYRLGLTSACADVVIIKEVDRKPRVPMILRAKPPFGNCWWIMGGAIFNYRSVNQFVLWKAARETGLYKADIETFNDSFISYLGIQLIGLLGVYRTPADDTEGTGKVCDTINLCYMAVYTGDQELHYDRDHTSIKWFSEKDLLASNPCGHWYPAHVARRAISIYKQAKID